MKRLITLVALLSTLAGCTTDSKSFYKNPAKADKTGLCRAYLKSKDEQYRADITEELGKRSVGYWQCQSLVQQQDQAIAAGIVAVALVGTAVAVCANNDCSGGGSGYSSAADWDAFYNEHGQIVWACREVYSGQFTYASNCIGKAQTDWRWPSKYAI